MQWGRFPLHFLPVLNIHSLEFWIYLLIVSIISYVPFHAKAYSGLIVKQEGSFEDDIKEASFDQVPTIDRDTAIRLGSRKMGEMLDLVSQYNVSNYYAQINYKDKPVRVTPLKYNGVMKWLGNKNEGIPNYIIVDMIDGKVELAKLESNMKYSKSDKFSRNIDRHIKISYPGDIIREIGFEINDEGTPYWIAPVYKTNIGWFGGLDVTDVIITNAITGEIIDIKSAVVDGDTHYYIIIGEDIFIVNVNVSKELPFLEIGESISLDYYNRTNRNIVISMKSDKL